MQSFTDMAMKTAEDIRRHLTERASNDAEFRRDLINNPRETIEQEFGFTIPDTINVHVHACAHDKFHLALPVTADLDEEQLESIAAGRCCCW